MEIGLVGGAVAGAAAGTKALFDYNRSNFKYDREMRQKTEFKTREWRSAQAGLWRDDVREIIGLTERKMDSYLVVATLQLGMVVCLFCEGRLEPGTPPWLMHMYMLTTSGAFMYLLMSVWLAMHASIVAQCASVRLLTQFVRLPIPSWQELQDMRTFGQSYEQLESGQMMRVPFTNNPTAPADAAASKTALENAPFGSAWGSKNPSSSAGSLPDSKAATRAIDPWLKEAHAQDRQGMYELMHVPAAMRRHVYLARRAATQYQAFDAFTRCSLSFGTHQLLGAVSYYAIGYCSIQDGAPWPAICVAVVMATASITVAQLDYSMSPREQAFARFLLIFGPLSSSALAWACAVKFRYADYLVLILLPLVSCTHAGWLMFALKSLGVEMHENGSMLPVNFRAVLYLDVFGWFTHQQSNQRAKVLPEPRTASGDVDYTPMMPSEGGNQFSASTAFDIVTPANAREYSSDEETTASDLHDDIREQILLWTSANVLPILTATEKKLVERYTKQYAKATGENIEQLRTSRHGPGTHDRAQRKHSSGDRHRGHHDHHHRHHSFDATDPAIAPWLKLKGYSDIGTETEYLFQPATGSIMHLPDGEGAADGNDADEDVLGREDSKDVLELAMLEEDMDRFIDMKKNEESPARTRFRNNPQGPAPVFTCTEDQARSSVEREKSSELRVDARDAGSDDDAENQSLLDDMHSELGSARGRIAHESYCPPSKQVPHPRRVRLNGEPAEDVIIGYGDLKPGRLPWQIFRNATQLMAVLWVLGSCIPAVLTPDMCIHPPKPLEQGAESQSHNAVQEAIENQARQKRIGKLEVLSEGKRVHTIWPTHSGFEPRAMTCDPTGHHIVVADDFGLYAAELTETQLQKEPASESPAAARQLRALDAKPANKTPQRQLVAAFVHQPLCTGIEGHNLQDVGLMCAGDRSFSTDCRALVLQDHGRQLVECPVIMKALHVADASHDQRQRGQAIAKGASTRSKSTGTSPSWVVSTSWLHGEDDQGVKEYVNSMAVASDCLKETDKGVREFQPESSAGCVVVGTSLGRIVELRSHFFNNTKLVPEHAMADWEQPVQQGGLHVFPDGVVVALHADTIRAFDTELDETVGEWRLPGHGKMHWLNICGGGGHFFLLGKRQKENTARIYRFDIPQKLRDWQTERNNRTEIERNEI